MAATLRQRGEVYAPPRYDAYIVLLVISLVAMMLGCALLYMDYSSYPDTKAPPVPAHQPAPAGGGVGGGAGGQQGGGGAGGQQGGAPAPAPGIPGGAGAQGGVPGKQ